MLQIYFILEITMEKKRFPCATDKGANGKQQASIEKDGQMLLYQLEQISL